MRTNSFRCPFCNKYTRHTEITAVEFSVIERNSKFDQFVAAVAGDYLRCREITSLFCGSPWKCCECGAVAERSHDGNPKLWVYKSGMRYVFINENLYECKEE